MLNSHHAIIEWLTMEPTVISVSLGYTIIVAYNRTNRVLVLVLGYTLRCLLEQRGEKGKGVIALREAEKRGERLTIICPILSMLLYVGLSLPFVTLEVLLPAAPMPWRSSVPRSSIPP